MKIALVNPVRSESGPIIKRTLPPLALLTIAAILEERNAKTKLLDENFPNASDFEKTIQNSNIAIVSTDSLDSWMCPSLNLDSFELISKKIRDINKKIIIIGIGPHTTFSENKLLNYCDLVIVGEPEPSFLTLPKKFKKKDFFSLENIAYFKYDKMIKRIKKKYEKISNFPNPLFEKLKNKNYYYPLFGGKTMLLETSRGCPHNCNFCFKKMVPKYSEKNIEDVITQLKYVVEEMKIKNILFIDSDFFLNEKKTLELSKRIKQEGLSFNWVCNARLDSITEKQLKAVKNIGCKIIQVGIETANQKIVDKIGKKINVNKVKEDIERIKKRGIKTLGFFTFGNSGETKEDIKNTIKFAKSLPLNFASFHITIPYPKTKFYKSVKNSISQVSKYEIPYANEENVKLFELEELKKKAYISFYLSSPRILGNLDLLLKPNLLFQNLKLFSKLAINSK